MIPEDYKKKLEGMAAEHSLGPEREAYLPGNPSVTYRNSDSRKEKSFMAGASAAWQMAQEVERKKYEKVYETMRAQIRLRPQWFQSGWEAQMEAILNPAQEKA